MQKYIELSIFYALGIKKTFLMEKSGGDCPYYIRENTVT